MSTTTQIITGAAMAGGGFPFQPTKLALQSTTNAVSLDVKVTQGATGPNIDGAYLYCYLTTSTQDVGTAVTQLDRKVKPYVFLLPRGGAGEVKIFQVPPQLIKGGFLYVWFDCPVAPNASSLDVYANEITV